jgi:hypothetical protein
VLPSTAIVNTGEDAYDTLGLGDVRGRMVERCSVRLSILSQYCNSGSPAFGCLFLPQPGLPVFISAAFFLRVAKCINGFV